MPLTIRPLQETDLPAFDRILESAFSLAGLMQLFYPNGQTAADLAHNNRQTLNRMRNDPTYRYMLVVDTDLAPLPQDLAASQPTEVIGETALPALRDAQEGRPVGVSVWKIFTEDRSPAQLDADGKKAAEDGFPPSADRRFMGAFFEAVGKAKRETVGGRKHVLLHILATDPAHHRRGVGAVALEWGLREADRLGLEAYLEASDMGKPLYARWGFEEVGRMDFDAREFGAEFDTPHTIMLRPAKKV